MLRPPRTLSLLLTVTAAATVAAAPTTMVRTVTQTQAVPGSNWTYLAESGDVVLAVSDAYPQRNGLDAGLDVPTAAAQGHRSSDGGASWAAILVPGTTDVDGVAVDAQGRMHVASEALYASPNGIYWDALPGFAPPHGTRVHTPAIGDDGRTWATIRPDARCSYDRYELRRSDDRGATAASL